MIRAWINHIETNVSGLKGIGLELGLVTAEETEKIVDEVYFSLLSRDIASQSIHRGIQH